MFEVNFVSSEAKTLSDVRSFRSSSGVNDTGRPFTVLLLSRWIIHALERLKKRRATAAQLMVSSTSAPSICRMRIVLSSIVL